MGDWYKYGYTLRALCGNCGAERQIPPKSVLDFFGQEHLFHEPKDNERIAKHLRCETCGVKGRATVIVVK